MADVVQQPSCAHDMSLVQPLTPEAVPRKMYNGRKYFGRDLSSNLQR